jgi:hypothetical protein
VVLLIVLVLPLALELGTDVQELAGAALAACVFQAMAHWAEIRGLLRDRINNHLQVVLFSLTDGTDRATQAEDRARLGQAINAVAAVSRTLEELSTDSLRRWQDRYAGSLNGDGAPER